MPIRVSEKIVFDPDTADERTMSAAELGVLDGVTAGTVTASRAVVVDANKRIDTLVIADSGLKLGAAGGTAVTSTAAELNLLDGSVAGTAVASKAAVLGTNKNLDVLAIADGGLALGAGAGTAVTATAAELNRLDDSLATNLLTRGAGVDTAESYAVGVRRSGTLIVTEIIVDISTLVGSTTDLDIIGESAAADCHWGQITIAKNGTLIGGSVTCLEVPAGGVTDIDFYSATVSTGTENVDVTTLTETALVTSGGVWTSGAVKGMTTVPPANDYLYIVNGAAGVPGTFSAGKFLITLYGLGA